MTILFGHPTGNPNAHHAALAHLQAGRLEAFCVPWMPSKFAIDLLELARPLRTLGRRLSRRQFAALDSAPLLQGRVAEWQRLLKRARGAGNEGLSYEANDWLMRTMKRTCGRPSVTAVHAYEDCSLWQFEEARRLGKACIYDMPIGYYPAWEATQADLARRYADWLPAGGLPSSRHVRPAQKRREMELADLVLAPSSFVVRTILDHQPAKRVALAPYGVDTQAWSPIGAKRHTGELTFLFAGQLSIRKGIPLLLQAWQAAGLRDARLDLVGAWHLSQSKLAALPQGVRWSPPCDSEALRERYRAADVFVCPSFFEGRALVLLEAMACGLPVIATEAAGAADVLHVENGKLITTGDLDALVDSLRWFDRHRDELPAMGRAARRIAEDCTWQRYRQCVTEAVATFA